MRHVTIILAYMDCQIGRSPPLPPIEYTVHPRGCLSFTSSRFRTWITTNEEYAGGCFLLVMNVNPHQQPTQRHSSRAIPRTLPRDPRPPYPRRRVTSPIYRQYWGAWCLTSFKIDQKPPCYTTREHREHREHRSLATSTRRPHEHVFGFRKAITGDDSCKAHRSEDGRKEGSQCAWEKASVHRKQ